MYLFGICYHIGYESPLVIEFPLFDKTNCRIKMEGVPSFHHKMAVVIVILIVNLVYINSSV